MKKFYYCCIAMLLIATMLAGCDTSNDAQVPATEAPAVETAAPTEVVIEIPTEAPTEAPAEVPAESGEDDFVYEGDASSYYIDVAYAEQIERYYTALSEKWNEEKYFNNGLSALPIHYYEGNPLDNVGFGFVDLDNDGYWELIIGAILNAETNPVVFEIWTLMDGEPVMLAQGSERNHYVLQYVEEDNMWYVAVEGSNSAFSHGTYYMMLIDGKLEIMQGIIFDAEADSENPWFMTYDMDWDVSNDEPIDEDMANAILDSHKNNNTALEYFPYSLY